MKYLILLFAILALGGGVYYYMEGTPAPTPAGTPSPAPNSAQPAATPPPPRTSGYTSYSPKWGDTPAYGIITLTSAGFLFTKNHVWPIGARAQFQNSDTVTRTIKSDKCPELNVGPLAPKEKKWTQQIMTAKVCDYYDAGNEISSDHKGTITTK